MNIRAKILVFLLAVTLCGGCELEYSVELESQDRVLLRDNESGKLIRTTPDSLVYYLEILNK